MKNEIYIKPYIDPFAVKSGTDLGAGQHGQVLLEGMAQRETVGYLEEAGGQKRWLTGLNEQAPEVLRLPDEQRLAKIKSIREHIIHLEKRYNNPKKLSVDDENFYEKVTVIRNDNDKFWNKIIIQVDNGARILDLNKTEDYIIHQVIENGYSTLVAPSLEHAQTANRSYLFYLDKTIETASTKTSGRKLRDQAGAELQKAFNKNPIRLNYMTKLVAPDPTRYTKSTPPDVLYEDISRYLDGELGEKNKSVCAEKFLKISEMTMEELKIRVVMADAKIFRYIDGKSDGVIYFMETGAAMGKTMEEVFQYLKNAANQDVWNNLSDRIEKHWLGN